HTAPAWSSRSDTWMRSSLPALVGYGARFSSTRWPFRYWKRKPDRRFPMTAEAPQKLHAASQPLLSTWTECLLFPGMARTLSLYSRSLLSKLAGIEERE